MAYTPVPVVSFGDLWTAAQHNTYIKDNFAAGIPDIFTTAGQLVYGSAANTAALLTLGTAGLSLAAGASAPVWEDMHGCCLKNSAVQTIEAAGAGEPLTFDTEDFDTDAYHSTVSSTDRITIPTGLDGKYLIYAGVIFPFDAAGHSQQLQIRVGGAIVAWDVQSSNNGETGLEVRVVMNLSATNYIQAWVYHDTAPDVDTVWYDGGSPYFGCELLR